MNRKVRVGKQCYIIPPDITPEENQKRIRNLEIVLSKIFKCSVTIKHTGESKVFRYCRKCECDIDEKHFIEATQHCEWCE